MLLLLLFVAGAKAQENIPLTFEAIAAGTVTLEKVGDFTPNSEVQYRLGETGNWSSYSYGTGISLQAGQKLQFRSTSSVAYAESGVKYSHFTCTADCYLYGNLGSLFNYGNSVPNSGCVRMFYGNTHIKNRTGYGLVLPATSLAGSCYREMFSGCTALTEAPALPATSLSDWCYQEMFSGCTALTAAPALPATSLSDRCYFEMFGGCTALTAAPALPATTLTYKCYMSMFSGCTHLIYVSCLAMDISADYCTNQWLSDVAATGTFVKASGMEHWTTGDSGIPADWTVEDYNTFNNNPLTFQAVEAGTITVKLDEGSTLNPIEYSLNGSVWTYVGWGIPIDLAVGDVICFRGNNGTCCVYVPINEIWQPAGFHFECSNPCYVYGNMMSLIDKDNFATNTTLTETYAFYSLFRRNDIEPNPILNHPSLDIVLPATTLTANCYNSMFMNCQGITRAPTLPATTLAEGCYSSMFSSCTSLATTPILPATTLASQCYEDMFSGCEILTVAPELPATELYYKCYSGMFYDCLNLTTAPSLPATTLANNCYSSMFHGCIKLTAAPALPATTLTESCYYGMFRGCKKLATAPVLPATALVNKCYQNMFYGCSKLNYVVCLATDIYATNCVKDWLKNVRSSGTFVKDPNMTSWPSNANGIPSGWTVNDIVAFTTDGDWDDADNWNTGEVPTTGNVLIAANATIPSGCIANVDFIKVNEGKTLTIEDGGQLIHDNAGVVATVKKNITGRGNGGGWNFIASPVATVVPSTANGLLSGDYDLYYYHEGTHKWRNYKGSLDENHADPGINLINGKGYLYANTVDITLSFTGALGTLGEIALDFNTDEGAELQGWNLVGNPYPCNAYVNRNYYVMNEDGSAIEPVAVSMETAIPVCTGVMVKADTVGETVTFSKTTPEAAVNQGVLQIVLSQGSGILLDKVMVSFNTGDRLEKFVFKEGNATLSIPQGGKELAIACAEKVGEMPLNFKAAKNGEYTITVNPEAVEMDYLHLIDNLTGADIDLLATPSYTFDAKTTDYASRFRLVFSVLGR